VIVDADREKKTIREQPRLTPPAHQPGGLPAWPAGLNVKGVVAGGMGHRAPQLSAQNGSEVLFSAPATTPEQLLSDYLEDRLVPGSNACDRCNMVEFPSWQDPDNAAGWPGCHRSPTTNPGVSPWPCCSAWT
jgi:hypothetical protein